VLLGWKSQSFFGRPCEVDRAFSGLKDVIEMRPIYHQTEHRVEAHIFIAFLAFLLDRALEKKLKSAGMEFSSKETWQMPKTVQVVEIDLGGGERKQSVTQGGSRAFNNLPLLRANIGQPSRPINPWSSDRMRDLPVTLRPLHQNCPPSQ